MIIDTKRIVHASSISSRRGVTEMELEGLLPELKVKKGCEVVVAVMFCDSLVIAMGVVKDYEEIEPSPDFPQQDLFARLSIKGHSVSISL